jgi:diphthamide biosynthesis enzyme Dph1/Dph2-like protein
MRKHASTVKTIINLPIKYTTMEYDLELEKACQLILKEKAKVVVVQLPDGLKPKANQIVERLASKTKARIIIWAGSCYGACDTPVGLDRFGVDLLIQWGHMPWKYASGNPHERPIEIQEATEKSK